MNLMERKANRSPLLVEAASAGGIFCARALLRLFGNQFSVLCVRCRLFGCCLLVFVYLTAGTVFAQPAAPTLNSPGSSSSPGTTISTLTPTMSWNASSGANNYGVYIYDVTTSTLVYDNDYVGNTTFAGVAIGLSDGGAQLPVEHAGQQQRRIQRLFQSFIFSGAKHGDRAQCPDVELAGQFIQPRHNDLNADADHELECVKRSEQLWCLHLRRDDQHARLQQ